MKAFKANKALLKFSLAVLMGSYCSNFAIAQTKPNIIYILADDLGYGDLGCYGQTQIKTPNIDALARMGMRFTQHYAGAPVCSPSRAVLMTGRDVGHATVRGNYETGPHGFGAGLPLKPGEITCGTVLKQRGYATAVIGKWGLGVEGTTGEPGKHGFDYSYGFLNQAHAHYQYPQYLYRNSQRIEISGNKNDARNAYSNTLFTNEALGFISKNKTKPFFLYLAYTTPHAELIVPEDSIFKSYKGRFKEKPYIKSDQGAGPDHVFGAYGSQNYPHAAYAACISNLDMCVGKVMAYLKAENMLQNTIVIFSSDNGPAKEGGAEPAFFNSSGGFRGKKRDVYEGGIREPLIAVWSEKIPANTVSTLVSGFQDMMPTLADLSGKPLDSQIKTEGLSFYPTLMGDTVHQQKHDYLYWEFHENKASDLALRQGNWKLVKHAPNGPAELYNLANDKKEEQNLADKYPQVVAELDKIMTGARQADSNWPLKYKTGKENAVTR